MSSTVIRQATSDDHPAFLTLFAELGVDDPPQDGARFTADLVPTTLIAEQDGVIAGYAYYRPMAEVVHLAHLVTAPAARRAGVGRALVREVARRARAQGCTQMMLNVRPDNPPAIRLYESEGLRLGAESHAIKIKWSVVDALPASSAPYVAEVRALEPADDARLERAAGLPAGMLADRRTRRSVLIVLERAGEPAAVACFDPAFPGVRPFLAPSAGHALSLLRAFRPHAFAYHDEVNLLVEDQRELAEALLGAGALLRFVVVQMSGPLTAP